MKAKRLVSAVLATAMAFSCAVSASADTTKKFEDYKVGDYAVYTTIDEKGNTKLVVFRFGDINGDDKVNVTDVMLTAASTKGKNMDKYEAWMIRADVDHNWRVDKYDTELIAAYVKGIKK